MYNLGFSIKRANSLLCVQGKYTTVVSHTELTPCRSRKAEARLSFKYARLSEDLAWCGGTNGHMESWPCIPRPVKWPYTTPAAWATATQAPVLQSIQGPSSPAPPTTPRGPVPSPSQSPWCALSGILAHCQTSPGLYLTSYWLSRCRGPLFIPFLRLYYTLFKCVSYTYIQLAWFFGIRKPIC